MARKTRGSQAGEPTEQPSAPRGPKNTPPVPPKGSWGHGAPGVRPLKVYTKDETTQHLVFVESLLRMPGTSMRQHVQHCRERFGFGQGRYQNLKKRIYADWDRATEADRGANKARQVHRIEQMLAHARGATKPGPPDPVTGAPTVVWERVPNHGAVARYEQLLANILGTNAPIEVNHHHDVSAALGDVIGNLTAEQLDACLEEYVETKRLAEEFRRLPGAAE